MAAQMLIESCMFEFKHRGRGKEIAENMQLTLQPEAAAFGVYLGGLRCLT